MYRWRPPRLRLLVLFWAWSGKWPDENTLGPDGSYQNINSNKKEHYFHSVIVVVVVFNYMCECTVGVDVGDGTTLAL
jgi:hypothetical protein